MLIRSIAFSAAAVPFYACSPGGAATLSLAAPGALAAAVGGVAGAHTLGRLVQGGMGELVALSGSIIGAMLGAALCGMGTALSQEETLTRSAFQATSAGACVAVGMTIMAGVLGGNRAVRSHVHFPSLLCVLWCGTAIAGLNCLAQRSEGAAPRRTFGA